ncbi:hypothetical protein BDP27DRAFT_1436646 [Rhodocollybia butyracea]|uniref:Uncharacterized protein n=1 Tax=Rhodocollybia butyracea TaxID=206335 RepID=A0A9P5P3U2_9AGAR|nr:hypothetical protein BDP27DRAFT_1436646 [Rhodocollybia butyracea]
MPNQHANPATAQVVTKSDCKSCSKATIATTAVPIVTKNERKPRPKTSSTTTAVLQLPELTPRCLAPLQPAGRPSAPLPPLQHTTRPHEPFVPVGIPAAPRCDMQAPVTQAHKPGTVLQCDLQTLAVPAAPSKPGRRGRNSDDPDDQVVTPVATHSFPKDFDEAEQVAEEADDVSASSDDGEEETQKNGLTISKTQKRQLQGLLAKISEWAEEDRMNANTYINFIFDKGPNALRKINYYNTFKAYDASRFRNQMDDNDARCRAMQKEVEWWKTQIGEGVAEGGLKNVKKMLRQIQNLGNHIHAVTGFELFGDLINVKGDKHGLTHLVSFTTTESGCAVRMANGILFDSCLRDTEAMFRLTYMESRGKDHDIGLIVNDFSCPVGRSLCDHNRKLFPHMWKHKWVLRWGKDLPQVHLNDFLPAALTHMIALTGWPTGERSFPGLDIKSYRALPSTLLRTITQGMMNELLSQYHDTDGSDTVTLQFEEWSEDDKALPLAEQGDVGLVFDLDGIPIVSVKHISAWWTAVADVLKDREVETDVVDMKADSKGRETF